MNKKKIYIVIGLAILLIIAWLIFGGPSNNPTPVTPDTTPPVNPVVAGPSTLYDGTYAGTFNYEYQDWDTLNSKAVSAWTPGSFTLSLTFKAVGQSGPGDPDPYVYLDVTNAISNEPGFGTGPGGVDVTTSFGGVQSAWLPVNPGTQDAMKAFLTLDFPNNSLIEVREGNGSKVDAPTMKISADGKTLSKNPDYTPSCSNNPCSDWVAETHEGILYKVTPNFAAKSNWLVRNYKFGSWNLTKVSP